MDKSIQEAMAGGLGKLKKLFTKKPEVLKPDETGYTPLHWAAEKGFAPVVKAIINTKVLDINVQDKKGWTALHYAVNVEKFRAAKLLIDLGADVNIKDQNGYSPIHLAAIDHKPRVTKLLIDSKADLNAPDNKGERPLTRAIRRAHGDVVDMLKQHGAQT